jgi:hypothetical protein
LSLVKRKATRDSETPYDGRSSNADVQIKKKISETFNFRTVARIVKLKIKKKLAYLKTTNHLKTGVADSLII